MKKLLKVIGVLIVSVGILIANPKSLYAASAVFKTTASTSKVVVGKTFTVTIKVSSTEALGSWEYTIDYNSSILSLVSGSKSVADYGNGSTKSKSYTYTFKAIKAGSSNISVKSYGAISWGEKTLSCSTSGATVKVITQADLQASYSKNNNLKSLSVSGTTLSPSFSSEITSYTAELGANTSSITISASPSDSKATISGNGTFNVIEGENSFKLVVTAENGSEKVYNILVNVKDPNPIKVTINNEELTIVKRISALTIPTSYTQTAIKIDDQDIPAFTSEITDFTLVGLKNSKGTINLYIYKDKTFTRYTELKLNDLLLYPIEEEIPNLIDYTKTKITINDEEVSAYKYSDKSKFAIINAIDLETGKKNTYMYDLENNTATFFNSEEAKYLSAKNQTYLYIIIGLLVETFILVILIILLLNKRTKQNKKRVEKIKKFREKETDTKEKGNETPDLEVKEKDKKTKEKK